MTRVTSSTLRRWHALRIRRLSANRQENNGTEPASSGRTGRYSDSEPSDTGVIAMPIATPEIYAQMLDRAKQQGFAYPAINVPSSQTLNAALKGFADAGSDGIVQISTGGAEYLSGSSVKDMVTRSEERRVGK